MDTLPRAKPLIAVALLALLLPLPSAGAGEAGFPVFGYHVAPSTLANANNAAEPTVGVDWRTGAIMYQAFSSTHLLTFDDGRTPPVATWTDRTPVSSVINVDPILFVDSATGRTFAGGLQGACSALSFSDDDGTTWVPMGNSCSGGVDHPTIGAGPWAGGTPPAAISRRMVYYCAQASVVQCSTSTDGGLTFTPGATVACGSLNPGFHGSVTVAADGTAFLPFRTCGSTNGVAVSRDNGLTWQPSAVATALSPPLGFDPDVATTPSGWVYLAYPTRDHGLGVALSRDGARAWNDRGDISTPAGVRSVAFMEVVAGDNARAAVAYLGSTTDGDPHDPGFGGDWHVYVAVTLDAGLTWTTQRAVDNVVQRGWICADGPSCPSGRNLLDFMDAQLDTYGNIVIAYADGCVGACEGRYGPSGSARATLLRQYAGSRLFLGDEPQPILEQASELAREIVRDPRRP